MNNMHDFIYEHKKEMDFSLDRIRAVLKKLPIKLTGKIIHVAGTNGKGTTCALIEHGLRLHKKRVGKFISPHVLCITERIQVNQNAIGYARLLEILQSIKAIKKDITLTFFEYLVLAGFVYFSEFELDYILLECGIGARLDATNIVPTYMGILTSVDYDHTEILGNTLDDIFMEKQHVWKPGNINIYSGTYTSNQVQKVLRAKNVLLPQQYNLMNIKGSQFIKHAPTSIVNGALCALNALGVNFKANDFTNFLHFGRLTKVKNFILDVAHNKSAFENLQSYLLKKQLNPIILMSMASTKDIEGCLWVFNSRKVFWLDEVFAKPKVCDSIPSFNFANFSEYELYLVCGSFKTVEFVVKKFGLELDKF